jgi:glycosyltransferase involved in cell wall biosynthesis
MHGARDYKTLPKYYGLAEALLLPSVSEAWGLVVNEAMAASLPVLVSSRCGCSHDLVEDGKNGFVFDPFDVDSIADTLARFARLPDAKRAAMGVRSREIISHWGLDHFVQGFDTAARAALAAHRRKPTLLDRLLLKALTLQ